MPVALADRFWDRVLIGDGCWEWQGATSGKGYGRVSVGGRKLSAHRVAWTLWNGPITSGLFILHHCDNPPCVRPDHLFEGTHLVNMRDARSKGRLRITPVDNGNRTKTHCIRGHALDQANTYVDSDGGRHCRICQKERTASRRQRLRNRP
jgi:hypothetical protein